MGKKNNNLWTLFLFYDGVLIKKVKMLIDEKTEITKQVLFIKVYGHKNLFGKNIITLMVRPRRLLKTEEEKKRTYWGVVFEKGVEVE
jgi:hypothetical protein